MGNTSEKQLICNALKAKQYQVEYIPTNSIFECERKDGSKYYVQWDMHRLGETLDEGSFTFIVQTDNIHRFTYDMNEGKWSGDELLQDKEIVEIFEHLDEFIFYEDYSGYDKWEIYCKVNNIDEDLGCYWYEDEDCPGNEDMEEDDDDEEIELPISYAIYKGNNTFATFSDLSFVIDEDDLKEIRDYITVHKLKGNSFKLTESDLWEFAPDLSDEITDFVTYHAKLNGYDPQKDKLEYFLLVSKTLFGKYL